VETMTRRERQRLNTIAELVAAAHKIVKDEGYEALTIRKLAESVGMATMSVYSYFADKQAILTALANDTFETLARSIREREPADPMDALRFGLRRFAAFGFENPNEFRTIFMTPKLHEHADVTVEEIAASNPAYQGLLRAVKIAIDAGALNGDAHAMATILWTVTHGAISLSLTFPLYPFGDPDAYVGRLIDMTVDALATKTVEPLSGAPDCC
jgi:AcrR family transcriptional regulator